MPCTPDYCDIHDYPVAPGGGWCHAVDASYIRQKTSRSGSRDEDLAGAILRLADIVERMEQRQPKWSPPQAAAQPKKEQQRRGGTPL